MGEEKSGKSNVFATAATMLAWFVGTLAWFIGLFCLNQVVDGRSSIYQLGAILGSFVVGAAAGAVDCRPEQ